MKLKTTAATFVLFLTMFNAWSQEYETCSFSEDAWAGDTAAITAFLISCGRIDTTNYDEQGNRTKDKPHHQSITMKLNSGKVIHNDSIYFLAQTMPVYPGGDEGLMNDIMSKVKYPAAARTNGTEGNVVVNFIINRDGTLANPKIVRGIGNGCEEEALRVVKQLKKWNPGTHKGKPVRVQMSLPVRFKLAN